MSLFIMMQYMKINGLLIKLLGMKQLLLDINVVVVEQLNSMIYKKIEEFFDKYFEIILKIALIINVVMIVILFCMINT